MSEARPEYIYEPETALTEIRVRERSLVGKLADNATLRKTLLLLLIALVWEVYARVLDNALVLPAFSSTVVAMISAMVSGELPQATIYTLTLLFKGYLVGVLIAAALTAFASATRLGADLLETLTAMFNPLPSIALLPLAMIWFGLGEASVIFVLVHAVLWAVALNTHSGFREVSRTLRMVGQNYGLTGLRYVWRILIPGAFPSILTGLKIGWAFAWRTLIAAELVFGSTS